MLALPLGVSILPSILLAGCPDREADEAAGKRTLVVMLDHRGALRLAMGATVAAPVLAGGLALARPELTALLGWGAAGGADMVRGLGAACATSLAAACLSVLTAPSCWRSPSCAGSVFPH